jgi:hypothetical protein
MERVCDGACRDGGVCNSGVDFNKRPGEHDVHFGWAQMRVDTATERKSVREPHILQD